MRLALIPRTASFHFVVEYPVGDGTAIIVRHQCMASSFDTTPLKIKPLDIEIYSRQRIVLSPPRVTIDAEGVSYSVITPDVHDAAVKPDHGFGSGAPDGSTDMAALTPSGATKAARSPKFPRWL
jgi:hypothetical protein